MSIEDVAGAIRCVEEPGSAAELDETGYLKANPDASREGLSAQEHYAKIGRESHRVQYINATQISDARRRKLSKVRFKTPSNGEVAPGEPVNYLSPAIVAEFGIPDHPPISSNLYPDDLLEAIRRNPDKLFLDLGAGLRQYYLPNVVNTEIYGSPSTDVICVGEDLPFADEQFDYVFALAVLEHTKRPWEVAQEMCRVLKPGGTIMVNYPFLQAVHGYPHHYFNATPQGNRSLFEAACDITSLRVREYEAPIFSVYWILANWRNSLPSRAAAEFDTLTIGELLARAPHLHLSETYCRELSQEAQMIIGAGSTLVGVKRSDTIQSQASNSRSRPSNSNERWLSQGAETEALRREINALRTSTSWRITSPARAIAHRLKGIFQ
jgi:SAM-dependent methyltransferase